MVTSPDGPLTRLTPSPAATGLGSRRGPRQVWLSRLKTGEPSPAPVRGRPRPLRAQPAALTSSCNAILTSDGPFLFGQRPSRNLSSRPAGLKLAGSDLERVESRADSERRLNSAEIALNFAGGADVRSRRVVARVTKSLTLPQQIPALVELHFELLQPGALLFRLDRMLLQLRTELAFLNHQLRDVGMDASVCGHESSMRQHQSQLVRRVVGLT